MSIVIKYSIRGTASDLLDLRTPGREFDLVGEEIVVTGSSASNAVYTAPGVSLDARNLAGGEDVIIFTHAWSDYTKSVSAVPGGIQFTYTDSVSGLTERVVVGNGVSGQTRDKLIFSDGSVLTQNANSALRADINAAMSAVAGYDVALTNLNVVTQTSTDSVYSVAAGGSGTDGSGATFAIGEAGQKSVYTGTNAVDKVYVKAGSIVDARSLLGGEDIIYFTGNWSEYAKSTTAVSGSIQFTRSIGGRTETVTVGNGVSALTRDKLVFADGAVLTQNVNAALRTNLNVSIDAITGFDSTTTTPFLSDVSSVTFSGGQSSGLTNGTANAGDTVVFDVAMKSAVTVSTAGGTPRLAINVGGQTKFADYDAASSTGTTLRFKYVVAAGDTDVNGVSIDGGSLVKNGGSIRDAAGNDADMVHAGAADNAAFKVDTTSPSIAAVAFAPAAGAHGGILNEGDVVTFEVTFSEAVTVTGTPAVNLRVGNDVRRAVYVGGTGTSKLSFAYTIAAGDTDLDGISVDANAITLDGATIVDVAGNTASLLHSSIAADAGLVVDTTAPTISSLAIAGQTGRQNGFLNAGDTVTFSATFSEAVFVDEAVGTPVLKVNVGGQLRNATYVSGSGTTSLLFSLTIVAGDSDLGGLSVDGGSLVAAPGSITDRAGTNANLAHDPILEQPQYLVDTTAPVATGTAILGAVGAVDDFLNAGDTVSFTVSFSKTVVVDNAAGAPTLKIRVGSTERQATYVSGSGSDTIRFAYVIDAGETDTDGISIVDNGLVAAPGAIRDMAGNDAVTAVSGQADDSAFRVDTTAPAITTVALSAMGALNGIVNVNDSLIVKATFGETVFVDISGGRPSIGLMVGNVRREAVYVSGSGSSELTFAYTVSAGDEDANGVSVPANGVTLNSGRIFDIAGNNAVLSHAALTDNPSYMADTTAPTVTSVAVTSAVGAANGWVSLGSVVTLTASFSEPVYVDTANGVPTMRIRTDAGERLAHYVSGSGTNKLKFEYTIAAGDDDNDGLSILADSITLNSGVITDLGGTNANLLHAAVANNYSYKVDTSVPSVSSVAILSATNIQNGTLNVGDRVTVGVSFTEAVTVNTQSGLPTVRIRIGDIERDAVYSGGSSTTTLRFDYTVQASDTDANGISLPASSLSLEGATIRDTAGNAAILSYNSVTDNAAYKVDTTAPTIATVAIQGAVGLKNGFLSVGDSVTFAVTFSETVLVDTSAGVPRLRITVGETTRNASYVSGTNSNTLLFTYVIQSGDADDSGISVAANALVTNNGKITDIAGTAASLTHSALVDDSSYKVDTTVPLVYSASIVSAGGIENGLLSVGDTVDFSVRFSKVVQVSTAAGTPSLKIMIGSVQREAVYLSGTGTDNLVFRYTVVSGDNDQDGIAVVSNGLVVPAGSIEDRAGNAPGVTFTGDADNPSYRVDTVSPLVTALAVTAQTGAQNETLNAGDTVTVSITFDQIVTVSGGTPTLKLLVGSTERLASYVAGSGTSALQFRYTIAAGDNDANGVAIVANGLSASGATIRDLAGNNAVLTHSLVSDNATYKVDTQAPTVSSVVFTGATGARNDTLNEGDQVSLSVTFSENVTVAEGNVPPFLKLTIGGQERNATYSGGSGTNVLQFTYQVQAGDTDGDGIAVPVNALSLGNSTIRDTAGNDVVATHPAVADNAAYRVDTTHATITSVEFSGTEGQTGTALKAGGVVLFTVRFDEVVEVDTTGGTPWLKVKVGSEQRHALYRSGSGTSNLVFAYTVAAGENDTTGVSLDSNALELNGGSIIDTAGNTAQLSHAALDDDATYSVDTTSPVISSVVVSSASGRLNGLLNAGDALTLTVSFSEKVFVDGTNGTPALKIMIGGQAREAVYASGSGSDTLTFHYTVQSGDNDADGLSDILVGARYNDASGVNAGRAYVIFGKTGTATVQLTDIARNSGGFAITGERSGDQFSFDVSNAGDVNGDGLGDLLVGAWNNATTASNAGRAYLILGRTDGAMGGTSVDVLGDASANALGDGGTAMTIVAGAGDDVVTLSAAGSIAYAGAGNDTIHINGAMISALTAKYGAGGNLGQLATIGGGSGVDTLTLDGAGLTLDLTQVSNASASLPNGSSRITSVERVDLTGTGNNTLKLSLNDVLDMSEANLFATTGRHQLMVTGDAGDTVQLGGLSSWTKSGTVDYAGGTYDAWNHNTALGTVYVLQTLTVMPV